MTTSATGVLGIPYAQFMPEQTDNTVRQAFWKVLQAVVPTAQKFVPGKTLDLHKVSYRPNGAPNTGPAPTDATKGVHGAGSWHSRGGIIYVDRGEGPGVLIHEIFHPTFAASPFNLKSGTDRFWSEAWCEAFRYAVGSVLLTSTLPSEVTWEKKIAAHIQDPIGDVLKSASGYYRIYKYPASLVIAKSGGTLTGLLQLWNKLLAAKKTHGDVFDRFFGYSPRHPSAAVIAAAKVAAKTPPPAGAPVTTVPPDPTGDTDAGSGNSPGFFASLTSGQIVGAGAALGLGIAAAVAIGKSSGGAKTARV